MRLAIRTPTLGAILCAALVHAAVMQGLAQGGAPQTAAAGGTGAALFRARCAECHGADAKGERGPDLTKLWTADGADERAFRAIRLGVPGSIMPPSQAPDEEIRAIVTYLRSVGTAGSGSTSAGNAANGERIFGASCESCHLVNGRGGRLGPDLSRIATSQPREAIARAIRDASASFAVGYQPVIVVTRDGQRIRGTRKGEDPFSIQIMDTRERLQGYLKADVREVASDSQSLMPSFGPDRLSDADLDDLLRFLATLRPLEPSGQAGADDAPLRGRP